MAVAFDAVGPSSSGTGSATSPLTWTHVNSGNGILVGTTIFNGSTNTVTAVTYGGVSVPFLGFVSGGSGGAGGVALYGLVGPTCPTGSNTVSMSFSDGANHNAGSISVSGAGSLGTAVTGTGTNTASVTASVSGTTTGGLIVAAGSYGGSSLNTFSGTNGVTVRWQHPGSGNTGSDNGVGGTVASTGGGAAQTVGFTDTGTDFWGIVAVEVKPPATASSPPPQTPEYRSSRIAATQVIRRRQNPDMPVPLSPTILDSLTATRRLRIPAPYYFDTYRIRGNSVSGLPVPVHPPERMQSVRRSSKPPWPRHGTVPSTGRPVPVQPPVIPDADREIPVRHRFHRPGVVAPTGLPVPVQPPERMQFVRKTEKLKLSRRGMTRGIPQAPSVSSPNIYAPSATRGRSFPVRFRKGKTPSGAIPSEPTVTTFRLCDGQNGRPGVGSSVLTPPSSPTSYVGNFEAGLFFAVIEGGCWFDGYWWWVPPGGDTSPQKFCLYSIRGTGAGDQQIVPGTTVTSGTLTAGQMNFIPLSQKVPLSIGIVGAGCGGLYGAMTAWSSANGFPDSAGQMGALYPNGIRNGPLITFGINNPSRSIGQGSTFGVATTDPTTAVAFGTSTNDFFWLDVQVSYTPPAGYLGPYQLYPNRLDWNQVSAADAAVNYNIAVEVRTNAPTLIDQIRYYSPPGTAQLATEVGVYRIDGPNAGTKLVSNTSPSWDGSAASGWIGTPITPTVLPPGDYRIYVFNGALTPDGWSAKDANSRYWDYGEGANGINWGPISVPNRSSASTAYEFDGSAGGSTPPFTTGVIESGQCTFAQSGSSSYPYLYVTGLAQNYWIDGRFTLLSTSFVASPISRIRSATRRIASGRTSEPQLTSPAPPVEIVSVRIRPRIRRASTITGLPIPVQPPERMQSVRRWTRTLLPRKGVTKNVAAPPPVVIIPLVPGTQRHLVRRIVRLVRAGQAPGTMPVPVPSVIRPGRYRKIMRPRISEPGSPFPLIVQPPNTPDAVRRKRRFIPPRRGNAQPNTGLPVPVQPLERMQFVRRWIKPLFPRRGVVPPAAPLPVIIVEVKLPVWVWLTSSIPGSTIATSIPITYVAISVPKTTVAMSTPNVSIVVVIPLANEKEV